MKNTMCRIGASRNVSWSDVNFEERWVIRKKRGGSERRWKVPLYSELMKILTEFKQKSTSEYIFPNKDNNHQRQYPRYLKALCKKAGIRPFTSIAYAISQRQSWPIRMLRSRRYRPYWATRISRQAAFIFNLLMKR